MQGEGVGDGKGEADRGENAIRWKAAADGWETLLLNGCKCRGAFQKSWPGAGLFGLGGAVFAEVKLFECASQNAAAARQMTFSKITDFICSFGCVMTLLDVTFYLILAARTKLFFPYEGCDSRTV